MGIRLTVLVATALFASPAIASAGQIEDAQNVALLYWADRGHSECEGLEIDVRYEGEFPGSAPIGGCTDEPDTRAYINLHEDTIGRSWVLNCTLVVHEYGHLVGLGHEPRHPVMDYMIPPSGCRNPTRLQARVRRYERRARGLSRRGHPRRVRRFEQRARQLSRQADRSAEFRVRAGI